MQARRVLVLGGARSGKSRFAQGLAEASGRERVFLATAQAFDGEMTERIARHQAEREGAWLTREEPLDLPRAIGEEAGESRAVLVDCLTLWLSNTLLAGTDPEAAGRALVEAVREARGPLILVSNEVGQGIVPATPLGRAFRDAQGRLNQQVAAVCDAVILVTAGCPTLVKPAPQPVLTLA
jgi:adenosylcobinamide kinase/adenosylcobinamide-phosphate guanylyltransferase